MILLPIERTLFRRPRRAAVFPYGQKGESGVMELTQLLQQVCAIVREDGEKILRMDKPEIYTKEGHANFVTSADLASQAFLMERLAPLLPQAHFFAEEQEDNGLAPGYNWLIDPIDGTTNFMRLLRCSSVSVGLVKDGRAVLGVVLNFYSGELFYAARGHGAYLNGARLHTANTPMEEAVILFGPAPYPPHLAEATLSALRTIFLSCGDLRRSGSAAIDLCSIAAGRADGFFEAKLSPWDYAASSVIVEEAGGVISSVAPYALDFQHPTPVLAGSGPAYELVLQAAKTAVQGGLR